MGPHTWFICCLPEVKKPAQVRLGQESGKIKKRRGKEVTVFKGRRQNGGMKEEYDDLAMNFICTMVQGQLY